MSKKVVLKTPEEKIVVVNLRTDEQLYAAPQNPPNTGTAYLTGTDLYRHVARSGRAYYYLYHWSMWQGSVDTYNLISEDEAKAFLIKKAGGSCWTRPSEEEMKRIEEVFPGIFDETG